MKNVPKHLIALFVFSIAAAALASAQTASTRDAAVNRLTAITELKLPEWRWHADDTTILHPEALSFDDTQWQTFTVGQEWSSGPVWFRRWVEVPAKVA